jgi:hypothetical protein
VRASCTPAGITSLHQCQLWSGGPCHCACRSTAWDGIKALEREAAFYSSILRGLQPVPPSEQWAAVSQRFHSLVEQQQQQQQALLPSDLGSALVEQVPEAEAVGQLQARCDALQQQLQAAHAQHQAAASAVQQERSTRLAAEQQCSQLRGQLQQLADAAAALKGAAAAQDATTEQQQQSLLQEQQRLVSVDTFADTLDECLLGDQWQGTGAAAVLFPKQQQQQPAQPGAVDAMRQLRQAFNAAAMFAGGQQQHRQQQQQQLHVVRLRLAYQQMLSQVQARYQQSLRQAEQQHKQVRPGVPLLALTWDWGAHAAPAAAY